MKDPAPLSNLSYPCKLNQEGVSMVMDAELCAGDVTNAPQDGISDAGQVFCRFFVSGSHWSG